MGQNKWMTKKARKSYAKKAKTNKRRKKRERDAKFARSRSKKTFAKLPKLKKKQLSNQSLTRNINNKNHDLAVQAAIRNGEPLRMVSTTKNTHSRKLKVKQ